MQDLPLGNFGEECGCTESLQRTPDELGHGNGNSRVIGRGKKLKEVKEIIEEDRLQGTNLRTDEEVLPV